MRKVVKRVTRRNRPGSSDSQLPPESHTAALRVKTVRKSWVLAPDGRSFLSPVVSVPSLRSGARFKKKSQSLLKVSGQSAAQVLRTAAGFEQRAAGQQGSNQSVSPHASCRRMSESEPNRECLPLNRLQPDTCPALLPESLLLRHHLDVRFDPCSPDSALPVQLWDPEDKWQPIQERLIVAREAPQSPPAFAFNGLPCGGPCELQSLFFLPILPQCVSLRPPCTSRPPPHVN
ncbi:hypothetical protein PAMP_023292 [Pampus punctatissimus]